MWVPGRLPLLGSFHEVLKKIMSIQRFSIQLVLLFTIVPALTGLPDGRIQETIPTTNAKSLRWWRNAKFGLFVHWGPVSLKGTEIGWSRGAGVPVEEYDNLYRQFNPTNFNAAAWAKVAKDAGMNYLVLTSKHHDGFCLWNTRFTDYNIINTPFRRDVIKELAVACRKQGITFCTYHSICDWHHPDYPLDSPGGRSKKPTPNLDRYNEYLKNQVAELIQKYGPLGVMWFDGEWEAPWTPELGIDLYRHCRRLQPSILVNNRVAKGRQDMEGTTRAGAFAGDFDTPEQRIGQFQNDRPWESCITIGEQWAWKPNDKLKSFAECIQTLVRTVGGGGNLLLNVGPMPNGEIEPRQTELLRQIGRWLRQNGKSIYGTRGGPFKPASWGVSTHRGRTIYLHLLGWPGTKPLRLPWIDKRVLRASLFDGGKVRFSQGPEGLELHVPATPQPPIDKIVVLTLDGSAAEIPAS
jgi:alpha-L-fucosidase